METAPQGELNILGKTVERLRRKAKGPVKWQPVATFLSIVWIDSAFFQLDKQVMIKKVIKK